jgi:hypothetical protein
MDELLTDIEAQILDLAKMISKISSSLTVQLVDDGLPLGLAEEYVASPASITSSNPHTMKLAAGLNEAMVMHAEAVQDYTELQTGL